MSDDDLLEMLPGKREQLSVSIRKKNVKYLKAFAKSHGYSVSGVVDVMVNEFIIKLFKDGIIKTKK